ncbi:sulfate adenylyltransferase [Halorubrum sp. ASP1]|uniref:sulfate adenylyltransferase n=1 Tax=Halorubrum sp. ASP1 TaxID=2518114 RepID=UPI0010F60A8D|nr:sulfate adenylyltransferase [Halorubrum sp. ASP1]TKX61652.1 sulfate adenylyltransferase [Halorubrum sp. ASP1]
MKEPHSGHLVDRLVDPNNYSDWIDSGAEECPSIHLDKNLFQDVLNIATGRFSPLQGFMNREDFLKTAKDMTLEDGTVWPLPVVLDVDSEKAAALSPGERAALYDPGGELLGFLSVDEVYKYNKEETAQDVFGTDDRDHPGVDNFCRQEDFLVGGTVTVFEGYRYNSHDLRPAESRVLFREYGWDTVVGFQTRNAPHRGHEYIQKTALEQVDGLLVQPKLGEKKAGDYQDDVIIGGYEELIDHYYPENQVVLSIFPSRMRYAGPREAVFDAIVRKNQGCTHFIIGRDHAGVGDYYDGTASHTIFETIGDIGIEPMLFYHAFYCTACDGMCSRKICPHGDEERIYPSGTTIREQIQNGESTSSKMIRPEIASHIKDADNSFVEG